MLAAKDLWLGPASFNPLGLTSEARNSNSELPVPFQDYSSGTSKRWWAGVHGLLSILPVSTTRENPPRNDGQHDR
jgi:hypothetical protein